MRGNLVWDICAFVPCKAGLTKRWSFTRVVSQKRYYCIVLYGMPVYKGHHGPCYDDTMSHLYKVPLSTETTIPWHLSRHYKQVASHIPCCTFAKRTVIVVSNVSQSCKIQ